MNLGGAGAIVPYYSGGEHEAVRMVTSHGGVVSPRESIDTILPLETVKEGLVLRQDPQ